MHEIQAKYLIVWFSVKCITIYPLIQISEMIVPFFFFYFLFKRLGSKFNHAVIAISQPKLK